MNNDTSISMTRTPGTGHGVPIGYCRPTAPVGIRWITNSSGTDAINYGRRSACPTKTDISNTIALRGAVVRQTPLVDADCPSGQPRLLRPHRAGRWSRAFTLIEVSIATAIAAVAVMGLMVVMVAASGIARKASDESLQGLIAQELFSEIKGCPFNAVSIKNASGASLGTVDLTDLTTNLLLAELYFDPDGVRVNEGPQYFKCAIKFGPMQGMTGQVAYAQLEFVEPAHTINPVITNIFYTRISPFL